ncbi:hypothetical protein Ocin01_06786, partial [Orchesella cincta]
MKEKMGFHSKTKRSLLSLMPSSTSTLSPGNRLLRQRCTISTTCGGGGSNDSDDDARFHRTWQRCWWLSNQIVFVTLLLLVTMSPVGVVRGEITCPPYQEIPYCSCFVLDDQLHIQCSGSDIPALKKSLQVLNGPVKSYSVYDLDARATVLPDGVTDNVTSPVFHVQAMDFCGFDIKTLALACY